MLAAVQDVLAGGRCNPSFLNVLLGGRQGGPAGARAGTWCSRVQIRLGKAGFEVPIGYAENSELKAIANTLWTEFDMAHESAAMVRYVSGGMVKTTLAVPPAGWPVGAAQGMQHLARARVGALPLSHHIRVAAGVPELVARACRYCYDQRGVVVCNLKESITHTLCECPAWAEERKEFIGGITELMHKSLDQPAAPLTNVAVAQMLLGGTPPRKQMGMVAECMDAADRARTPRGCRSD